MKHLKKMTIWVAAICIFAGTAYAHCGMCGSEGHGDKKQCAIKEGKECEMKSDKQCSLKADKKGCEAHCSKPCCSKAKTNFGPKKR